MRKRCFSPTEFKHHFITLPTVCATAVEKNNRRRFSEKFATWDIPAQVQQGLQISLWATRPSPYDLASPAAKRGIQQRRVRLALNADAAADHHLPNAFHQPFELQGVAVLKSISAIQHWCSSVPYPPMVMALKTPCGSAK
jgi:hypothetical protein